MNQIVQASIVRRFACLVAVLMTLSALALAQQQSVDKKEIGKVPVPPSLAEHSNWFTPRKIYHLRTDHYPLKQYPDGLDYDVYSAVGYDLANTIVILGPKKTGQDGKDVREIVVVDTLGNPGVTKKVIRQFREQKILPEGKLPIRAIVYTHNHIDHAYGVWGYLLEADRPPCKPANPTRAGPDIYFNIDKATPDCVTIIGQHQINQGVGTTALVDGTIIDARSMYMYGSAIPLNHVNDGIGPQEKTAFRIGKTDGEEKPRGGEEQTGDSEIGIVGVNTAYRMPSRTFTNEMTLTAAGVQMKLVYVPSETNDELAVFVPDGLNKRINAATDMRSADWGGPGLLLSAEVIQGPAFPNLYSLRGTAYRNPATWFRSVDKLRMFDSWCMVPSHGPPLCEASNIQKLLKNFRDAIQFTHDQTIRFMNKGYTMEELAPLIEDLYMTKGEHDMIMGDLDQVKPIQNAGASRVVNPRDYLMPFYGSVTQSVRAIYTGSVGWFQGDPVALRPTPPKQLARHYLKLICGQSPSSAANAEPDVACGAQKVNSAAQEALSKNEDELAAELTTLVIRAYADVEHPDKRGPAQFETAKQIKAQAFLKLAATETYGMNPNWRNWYITAAHELQGIPLLKEITSGLVSPGVVSALPAGAWVNSLSMRLRAEITAKNRVRKTLGFWFPASGHTGNQGFGPQGYVLNIRGGIAEFIEQTPRGEALSQGDVEKADLAISIEKGALDALLYAEAKGEPEFRKALIEAYNAGIIKPLNGTDINQFAEAFFGFFEPKPVAVPPLTVR